MQIRQWLAALPQCESVYAAVSDAITKERERYEAELAKLREEGAQSRRTSFARQINTAYPSFFADTREGGKLYAQWSDPITVTYNYHGGSGTPASENFTNAALTLPTPTRANYWFDGWYDAESNGNKIGNAGDTYSPSASIELHAHWNPNYTVTYDYNEGSGSPANAVYSGTALTLPTPTRTGYTFNGWYTAASGGTKVGNGGVSYTPTADITLHAQWTVNTYKVTITTSNSTTTCTNNATGATISNGGSVAYNTVVKVELSYSQSNNKTFTIKDANGSTVTRYSNEACTTTTTSTNAGIYYFKMPASAVTINSSSSSWCLAEGTLITLADGAQKPIEEITVTDKLLVWDFLEGKVVERYVSSIAYHGDDDYTILTMVFSNGKQLKIIGEHGIFDYDLNQYICPNEENIADYIGHRFPIVGKEGVTELVTLVDVTIGVEHTGSYAISSDETINVIAEGILTTNPPVDFYSWQEMDENCKMRYDLQKLEEDIQTYGLYAYDVFATYLTEEQFESLRFAYLRIPVEKGQISLETVIEMSKVIAQYMLDAINKD